MAETARLAVFHGTGWPFEVREYPVPDPEAGAMLIKMGTVLAEQGPDERDIAPCCPPCCPSPT